jgi:RimJ/RimL family protein N-acetyltransferase
MLHGETVALRARIDSDVAVLHTELYDDVATRMRGDNRPWLPLAADSLHSPFRIGNSREDVAFFSVVERASSELVGEALVYAIDGHNRTGRVGLALRPAFRGRGLARETLALLCRYGFDVRGLNRLQLETLSDNEPMINTALSVGFVEEGRLRSSRSLGGNFGDEVVFGLLASEREK